MCICMRLSFHTLVFCNCPSYKSAMIEFERIKFRQCMTGNQFVRIAGINTGEKRIHSIIEETLSQSSHHHFGNRFIGISTFFAKWFTQDTEFIVKCKKRCCDPRNKSRRQSYPSRFFPDIAFVCRCFTGRFEYTFSFQFIEEFDDLQRTKYAC